MIIDFQFWQVRSQTCLISGGSLVAFWCWDKMLRFFIVFREGGCLPSLLFFVLVGSALFRVGWVSVNQFSEFFGAGYC